MTDFTTTDYFSDESVAATGTVCPIDVRREDDRYDEWPARGGWKPDADRGI